VENRGRRPTVIASRRAGAFPVARAAVFACLVLGSGLPAAFGQAGLASPVGYALEPVSAPDGAFDAVDEGGARVLRSREGPGGFSPYVYFRLPADSRDEPGTAYLELTYKDVGVGRLAVEYDAPGPDRPRRRAELGYGMFLGGSGRTRTAVFRLDGAGFRRGRDGHADLRVCSPARDVRLHIVKATLSFGPTPLFKEKDAKPWLAPYSGPTRSDIDATTLHHKVLCGYQGWFRCPGDLADQGWRHWSRRGTRIDPASLTFEMWPDLAEFPADERYPAPGFTNPDGTPAELFSSADGGTVERHFRWMEQYGIDGVFVQRFLVNVGDPSYDRILGHVRDSANRTGRAFAVCYDLSGTPEAKLVDRLVSDWKRLVDEMRITQDRRYLHHDGKPVLFVWGFYPDRFGAATAHRLIDALKGDEKAPVALVGGCPWPWRKEKDAEWARAYRRLDVISPWNVGNATRVDGRKQAATGSWAGDFDEAKKAGMGYLPVIYPGFAWANLKGAGASSATIPRLGGEFFWRQFAAAADLGAEMAYVAMFDEVDEATAIFKVSNTPPAPGRFQTYEGLPSDWYLRLTGEGSKLIRGERKNQATIPIEP
jgi:hypothetical protein